METSSATSDQAGVLAVGPRELFAALRARLERYILDKPGPNRLAFAETGDRGLFELRIDTKYYNANKRLRLAETVPQWTALTANDASLSCVEAVLVLFDAVLFDADAEAAFDSSLERLDENALRVLVSRSKDAELAAVKRLKEQFEFVHFALVDLEPGTNERPGSDAEAGDEEEEIEDLLNLFFVHPWQEMDLVKAPNQFEIKKGPSDLEPSAFNATKSAPSMRETAAVAAEKPKPASTLADVLPNAEDAELARGDDDFEHLLMNLKDMRVKAEGLSADERKKYAENVVLNFWRAIGGDEAEIGDLDDDLSDVDD